MIGPVQSELLRRARGSARGFVLPKNAREYRSAERLVARGILERPVSWPCVYRCKELDRSV